MKKILHPSKVISIYISFFTQQFCNWLYTNNHSPVILETPISTPSVTPSSLVKGRARLLYQSDYPQYLLVVDNCHGGLPFDSPLMLEQPVPIIHSLFSSLHSRRASLLYHSDYSFIILLSWLFVFVRYLLVLANCKMSSWVPVCLSCFVGD